MASCRCCACSWRRARSIRRRRRGSGCRRPASSTSGATPSGIVLTSSSNRCTICERLACSCSMICLRASRRDLVLSSSSISLICLSSSLISVLQVRVALRPGCRSARPCSNDQHEHEQDAADRRRGQHHVELALALLAAFGAPRQQIDPGHQSKLLSASPQAIISAGASCASACACTRPDKRHVGQRIGHHARHAELLLDHVRRRRGSMRSRRPARPGRPG